MFTILAPNLRQPLSGNRLTYYLFLALILIAQGCFLFKPTADDPVVDTPDEPVDTPSVVVIDTLIDTTDVPIIDPQRAFEIAVLLPFAIDQEFIDSFDLERRTTQYRPQIAIEMYEGMLLALRDLDTLGIDLTIHVHDTKNRLSEIAFLLALRDMADVDMIIGPLFPQNLAQVASLIQEEDIWLVSPFASYTRLDSTHLRYLNFNPTLWAHQRTMADFLAQQDSAGQVLIIHSSNPADKQHATNLLEHLKTFSPFSEVPPGILLEAAATGIYDSTYLHKEQPNWVVVTSYNEVFVNNVIRTLGDQVRRFPIHLMGMPGWLDNFESLRLDYLNDLQYHQTEALVMDTTSAAYLHVDSMYRSLYGFRPSAHTLKGYELMYTHVLMLAQDQLPPDLFAPTSQKRISKGVQYIGQTRTTDEPGREEVEFYVNGQVEVLRYKDFRLEHIDAKEQPIDVDR